jgi:large subunit ribosomal protein L2
MAVLIKSLTRAMKFTAGRNSNGRITSFHRGGQHKRRYRLVDFHRRLTEVVGQVVSIQKDPARTAELALVSYSNGVLSYILAPAGIKVGDKIRAGMPVAMAAGDSMFLSQVPIGALVHNVEISPGCGAVFSRAAGSSLQVLRKKGDSVFVRMKSGEVRLLNGLCKAVIGIVGNLALKFKKLEKAGQNRWRGHRPVVRGVAMNPVDHPHGGGQGKTKGGRCSVSPWSQLTKGKTTRAPRRNSSTIVYNRRGVKFR